jgi:hypothetical protein
LQAKSNRYGQANVQSFLLQAQSSGSVVKTILTADNLSMADNSFYLEGIEANPSLDLDALTFQKETRVQIERGRFKLAAPNEVSGTLKSFDAIVGLHLPERFLKSATNISDLEIWNDQVTLIMVPELVMDMSAMISATDSVQVASAQFTAKIIGENEPVFTGDLTSQLSSLEGQDCLAQSCSVSNVTLDLKYEYDGEQVTGKGSCSSRQCGDKMLDFVVETSDTPKIVMGLTKQKIVNPLALAWFAGTILRGQKVGSGHKIKF